MWRTTTSHYWWPHAGLSDRGGEAMPGSSDRAHDRRRRYAAVRPAKSSSAQRAFDVQETRFAEGDSAGRVNFDAYVRSPVTPLRDLPCAAIAFGLVSPCEKRLAGASLTRPGAPSDETQSRPGRVLSRLRSRVRRCHCRRSHGGPQAAP